ncbi:MAG TPA: hypothetical protein EYP65_04920 [Armatimonadetes bacterium]|nr:hypothetical protein [Armatimonadota bacterium]
MLPLLLLTNLLFNGSLEDLNGDGRPDGWEAAFPEVRMMVGVKGEAVECQLDTGRYWRLLRSRPFPVRVGQKFVVSIWLKGEKVKGVHVKFHLFDAEGRRIYPYGLLSSPLSVEGWALSAGWGAFHRALPRVTKSGSWDWERWEGIFEVEDGRAKFARLKVWAERKGGRFWADEARVEEFKEPTERAPHFPG